MEHRPIDCGRQEEESERSEMNEEERGHRRFPLPNHRLKLNRGRHPESPSFNVLAGGPGSLTMHAALPRHHGKKVSLGGLFSVFT